MIQSIILYSLFNKCRKEKGFPLNSQDQYMNTVTKKMTKQEIFELKERIQAQIINESQPSYTYYQVKTNECTITAYTSGKVVFQGKDIDWLAPQEPSIMPQAGSDEVGTGDYFGPVVVCACIVNKEHMDYLQTLGVHDSKQITDNAILKMAPKIMELCPHSVLVVSNKKYNEVHLSHNMVDIKCLLHNQAYINLESKGYTLPDFIIIDQFVQEKTYYKYLAKMPKVIRSIHFETKAENKYISVACASIIARYTFLQSWKKMEEAYNFHFEKGAGSKVDQCARAFVEKFGKDALSDVAKLHFANTKRI